MRRLIALVVTISMLSSCYGIGGAMLSGMGGFSSPSKSKMSGEQTVIFGTVLLVAGTLGSAALGPPSSPCEPEDAPCMMSPRDLAALMSLVALYTGGFVLPAGIAVSIREDLQRKRRPAPAPAVAPAPTSPSGPARAR